ncbi:MAG: RIP metalloprotease RseP [bacterium]|nr:RIP metalloprotease RseP [bacterium]
MSAPEIFRILQVAFGIGLVIFVHEGGHFIAARLCKVRVEVFSLGFGPKLIGWRRGDTLYQIAAVPLGGFVRMAGEMPDERGRAPRADELAAKSVGQRFFIYSGGVIMNVIFALVLFPIILSSGVPFLEPVLDAPTKGTPAWHAKIPEGTRVVSANGKNVFDFWHIPQEVAVGGKDPIELEVMTPGATSSQMVTLTPEYSDDVGFFRVGVSVGYESNLRVKPGGVAEQAGVQEGDILVSVADMPQSLSVVQQWSRAATGREPVTVRILRDGEPLELTVTPEIATDKRAVYGFQPFRNIVHDLRDGPATRDYGLEVGDRVISVNGQPIQDAIDFLPALLAQDGNPRIEVVRGNETVELTGPALDETTAVDLDFDVFLSIDKDRAQIGVQPDGAAAAAGVRDGDRVLRVDDELVTGWQSLYNIARSRADRGREVTLTVVRGGDGADDESATLTFTMAPQPATYADFGFGLPRRLYEYQTHGFLPSIQAGMTSSWRFLNDAWLTLKKMLTAEVSPKNLGGIITISKVSYDWSSQGWEKLFFFLCLLSVNLAFLNVLPIPLLDGGHLLFCIVEAIKGSPVSEKTLGYSQVVGLVLILSLMVYVTYNDVVRLF